MAFWLCFPGKTTGHKTFAMLHVYPDHRIIIFVRNFCFNWIYRIELFTAILFSKQDLKIIYTGNFFKFKNSVGKLINLIMINYFDSCVRSTPAGDGLSWKM